MGKAKKDKEFMQFESDKAAQMKKDVEKKKAQIQRLMREEIGKTYSWNIEKKKEEEEKKKQMIEI